MRFYQDKDGDYWIRDDNDPYDMAYCLGAELATDQHTTISVVTSMLFTLAQDTFGLMEYEAA